MVVWLDHVRVGRCQVFCYLWIIIKHTFFMTVPINMGSGKGGMFFLCTINKEIFSAVIFFPLTPVISTIIPTTFHSNNKRTNPPK